MSTAWSRPLALIGLLFAAAPAPAGDRLFAARHIPDDISRFNLPSTSPVTIVASAGGLPEYGAVDPTTGRTYWAGTSTTDLRSWDLDGTGELVIGNLWVVSLPGRLWSVAPDRTLSLFADLGPGAAMVGLAVQRDGPLPARLVPVGRYALDDACDARPGLTSFLVTSDEDPSLERGAGGGSCADAVLRFGSILLRAERSGHGDGRVYGRVALIAHDVCGNETRTEITDGGCDGCPGAACVPHDRSPKTAARGQGPGPPTCRAGDDGQRYAATDPTCRRSRP